MAKKPSKAKPVIAVAHQRLHKNSTITNPKTGTPDFGRFPQINTGGAYFMGGPIYLRYGDHSYNWGLEHIWQAHFASIPDLPTAISTVSTFVSEILLPGTNILYESGKKSTIVHSATGLVIVEERLDGNNNHFYSVVTAYKRRSAYGYKIGQL